MDEEGRCLLAGDAEGAVRFWRLTGPAIASKAFLLDGHADDPVVAIAVSADGEWAVTGGWDKYCYLWNLSSQNPSASPLRLSGHGGEVNAIALSPDGRWAATGDEDGLILLWYLPVCRMIQQAASELDLDSPGRIQA
jgi:WD40 repeat protein